MKVSASPFSVYDFFGYLVPGIVFIISSYLIFMYDPINCCLGNSIYLGEFASPDNVRSVHESIIKPDFGYFIPAIILCYIIGHSISYLSSITLEKWNIWTLGYPSIYLLKLCILPFWFTFEKGKIRLLYRIYRVIMFIALLPVTLFDLIVGHFAMFKNHMAKPLDSRLINQIKNEIGIYYNDERILYRSLHRTRNFNFFRVIYQYAILKSERHFVKSQYYQALYGFSRTCSFSFVLLTWLIGVRLIFTFNSIYVLPFIISLFLSYLLYLNFSKFYSKYTKESLIAFFHLHKNNEIEQ